MRSTRYKKIDSAHKVNRNISRKSAILIRIDLRKKQVFKKKCKTNGVEMSEQIRVLIDEWLEGKQQDLYQ